MKAALALALVIDPAMDYLAGLSVPRSPEADVLLLAIGRQESGFRDRIQGAGNEGPARGFWQFERIAVAEMLRRHPALIGAVMTDLAIPKPWTSVTLHDAMALNDTLACVLARLLLRSDPAPLPAVGRREAAWGYYLRNWRPGKPKPLVWQGHYEAALAVVAAVGRLS